jgi:hypothetical protein
MEGAMPQFRKRPVVITAEQWFPGKPVEGVRESDLAPPHGWIDTLEGTMAVEPGDWVITGVKGERYACKPDIFELTYEPA